MISTILLVIEGKNLLIMNTLEKSEYIAVLSEKDRNSETWKELSRSEVVHNDNNPKFAKTFSVTFHFEIFQEFKFSIYDKLKPNKPLSEAEDIGECIFSIGKLMKAKDQILELELISSFFPTKSKGNLIIKGEEILTNNEKEKEKEEEKEKEKKIEDSNTKYQIVLRDEKYEGIIGYTFFFQAETLDKKDTFGLSDPYLIIYRIRGSDYSKDDWLEIYKTETLKKTLNPVWESFWLTLETLGENTPKRPFKIECWDWNRIGSPSFIGKCFTTFEELISDKNKFELIEPNLKEKKKDYKNSGFISVTTSPMKGEKIRKVEEKIPIVDPIIYKPNSSLLEFIKLGLEIRLSISIDFTSSNSMGKNNLHAIQKGKLNGYQQAILTCGEVLSQFSKDPLFPTFGFGGKQKFGAVHCFNLNGNPYNPNIETINGVLQVYSSQLTSHSISFHYPTNFSPTINEVIRIVKELYNPNIYMVLLILTDGMVTDLKETKKAIFETTLLPISILIVGIGDEDFDRMDEIGTILEDDNVKAKRKNVQFVALREYLKDTEFRKEALSKSLLSQIPSHIDEYLKLYHSKN